jgi:hypothetical protein
LLPIAPSWATGIDCGKRLKALPELVNAMERHGHLRLALEVRTRAATGEVALGRG